MNIVKQNNLKIDEGLVNAKIRGADFVDGLIRDYGSFNENEYGENVKNFIFTKVCLQVKPVYQVLNGNIYQKNILDLGCGSYGGTFEAIRFDPKMYEPWFCRALLKLGANPIGIDVGNLNGEKFEHYKINLLLSNSLDFIKDNTIDVAHTDLLFNSPTLKQMGGFGKLRDYLIPQLERIIKPDGFFLE